MTLQVQEQMRLSTERFWEFERLLFSKPMRITKPIYLFAMVLLGLSWGCGGDQKTTESTAEPARIVEPAAEKAAELAPPAEQAASVPDVESENEYSAEEIVEVGFVKMEGSDCSSCHAKEEKIIGPPLLEIAMEYENNSENIDKLAVKVIEGGKGVWGDYPMPPHPGLSKKDAKAMVAYILQLK